MKGVNKTHSIGDNKGFLKRKSVEKYIVYGFRETDHRETKKENASCSLALPSRSMPNSR